MILVWPIFMDLETVPYIQFPEEASRRHPSHGWPRTIQETIRCIGFNVHGIFQTRRFASVDSTPIALTNRHIERDEFRSFVFWCLLSVDAAAWCRDCSKNLVFGIYRSKLERPPNLLGQHCSRNSFRPWSIVQGSSDWTKWTTNWWRFWFRREYLYPFVDGIIWRGIQKPGPCVLRNRSPSIARRFVRPFSAYKS